MQGPVRIRLNGSSLSLDTDQGRTLLWVLRTDLGLTGTKYGCGAGICGACTVLVDGEAKRSCQTKLGEVAGKDLTTIEGLGKNGGLTPLQKSFVEHGAFQCGFCTSGMIMNAHALLLGHPQATREEIAAGMEDNLCRCGAHRRILAAIEDCSRGAGPK